MSRYWTSFRQWLYPREFRIPPVDGESALIQMVARALAALEEAALASATRAAPPPVPDPQPAAAASLPNKTFLVDLCNQVHRVSRSANKLQGSGENERLKGHLDRLNKVLEQQAVKWEDLTGQTFDPGRSDFEPLGEPQATPGLRRDTIIQCERPVIRLNGKMIQSARGIVGTPQN